MSLVCTEILVQVATRTLLSAVRKIAVMQGINVLLHSESFPQVTLILTAFANLSLTHVHTISTGTTDSGIITEPSKPSVDQQINHYLIQLQMYASMVTQTLMRTEYSTT